jgi:hypothetical protein
MCLRQTPPFGHQRLLTDEAECRVAGRYQGVRGQQMEGDRPESGQACKGKVAPCPAFPIPMSTRGDVASFPLHVSMLCIIVSSVTVARN